MIEILEEEKEMHRQAGREDMVALGDYYIGLYWQHAEERLQEELDYLDDGFRNHPLRNHFSYPPSSFEIQELEEKRNYATHLFNTLVDVVPAGIYLNNVAFANEQVDVKGMSEANNRLAKMMRNIDGSGWLGDSYISSIIAGPSKPIKLSKFAMKFVVVPESKGEE